MDEAVRAHGYVKGLVQGVWFRQSTAEKARELGLGGWVRNLADGRVEFLAEGTKAHVEELLTFARVGPPLAKVEGVEYQWEPPTGDFREFKVR